MFNRPRRSSTIALLAASLLFAIPMAANAQTRSVSVSSADLNLASKAGQTALQYRIARAIDTVCGSAHGRTTAEAQAYAACSKQARAGAATQFDTVVAKAQMSTKVAADAKKPMSAE